MARNRRRRAAAAAGRVDILRAGKKLRQAEFFLGHLAEASRAWSGSPRARDNAAEHLEFWFSACLSSTRSAHQVMRATWGEGFARVENEWRRTLERSALARFRRMLDMRDDDVHRATTPTQARQTFVPDEPSRYTGGTGGWLGPRAEVEHENPDGKVVRGSALRGALGLYLQEPNGRIVDACTACHEFIEQMRALMAAVEAAAQASPVDGSLEQEGERDGPTQ
jgi:hypothetical protein